MTLTTFRGVVRNGKVEPASPFELPDGSEVYVVVPAEVTSQTARRKVNAWLVNSVGNLLMANDGELAQVDARWVWRFGVYITAPSHAPWGPIGTVDVDAASGEILHPEHTKTALYERGRTYPRPL